MIDLDGDALDEATDTFRDLLTPFQLGAISPSESALVQTVIETYLRRAFGGSPAVDGPANPSSSETELGRG